MVEVQDIRVFRSINTDVAAKDLDMHEVRGKTNLRSMSPINGDMNDAHSICGNHLIFTAPGDIVHTVTSSNKEYSIVFSSGTLDTITYISKGETVTLLSKSINLGNNIQADIVGDMLYWVDGINPARYLHIEKAKTFAEYGDVPYWSPEIQYGLGANVFYDGKIYGTNQILPPVGVPPRANIAWSYLAEMGYVAIHDDDLLVNKPMPKYPPAYSIVEVDTPTNIIQGNAYQFSYRFLYSDGAYSAYSTLSRINENSDHSVLYEENYQNGAFFSDFTHSALELELVDVGGNNVEWIEIVFRKNPTGQFYLFDRFKKYDNGSVMSSNHKILFTGRIGAPVENSKVLEHSISVPHIPGVQTVISESRLVYGDYSVPFGDVAVDIDLSIVSADIPEEGFKKYLSFKDGGLYKVGIQYSDGVNKSLIYTSNDCVIDVPQDSKRHVLSIDINHTPPPNAKTFSIFISSESNFSRYNTGYIYGDEFIVDASGENGMFYVNERTPFTINKGDFLLFPTVNGMHTSYVLDYDAAYRICTVSNPVGVGNTYYYIVTQNNVDKFNVFYDTGLVFDVIGGFHQGSESNQTGTQPCEVGVNGFDVFLIYATYPSDNTDVLRYAANIHHEHEVITVVDDLTETVEVDDYIRLYNFDSYPDYKRLQVSEVSFVDGKTHMKFYDTEFQSGDDDGIIIISGSDTTDYMPETRIESKDFSTFYESEFAPLGKPQYEYKDFGTDYSNYFAHGGVYSKNTEVNNVNYFAPTDYTFVNYDYGRIRAMRQVGFTLKILQENKVTSLYVNRTMVHGDGDGSSQLITSNTVFGTKSPSNDSFGTKHPRSVVSNNRYVYFYDESTARVLLDSPNGISEISMAGIQSEVSKYTNDIRAHGGDVFAVFNHNTNEYIITFRWEVGIITHRRTLVFSEPGKAWDYSATYQSDGYSMLNDEMLSHNGSKLYLHSAGDKTLNGAPIVCSVDVISNKDWIVNKEFLSLAIDANTKFYTDGYDITIEPDVEDRKQGTKMTEQMLTMVNGGWWSHIGRNAYVNNILKPHLAVFGEQLYGSMLRLRLKAVVGLKDITLRSIKVFSFNNKIS